MVTKSFWTKTLEYIRTIKFGIVFYNVFILIFSVSFVILYSQKNNDEMIITNLQSFMELSNKNIKDKIYEEFEKIDRLLSSNVTLLHNVRETTEPPPLIDDIFYSILRSSLYVSSVYYAKKNNYFSMAMPRTPDHFYKGNGNKKLPHGTALGWSIIYNSKHLKTDDFTFGNQPHNRLGQIEHWYYFDTERKLLDTEIIYNNTFLATTRPWYALAEFSITPKWTDAYLFQLSRVPGITAAVGIIDRQKNSNGVFAIDLSLDKLNALLTNLKMIDSSRMYIVDYAGNIIASTEELRLQETHNQKFRLPSINDSELQELKAIVQQKPVGVTSFLADFQGKTYVVLNDNFEYSNLSWRLININSVDDILSPNLKKRHMTIGLSFLLLLLSAGIMYIFAHRISRHIAKLSAFAERITRFETDAEIDVQSPIMEIQQLSSSMGAMRNSLDSFTKYVPKELVLKLMKGCTHISEIGGEHKEVTLFFSDIADFTAISEDLKPQDLIAQLTDYFSSASDIIMNNTGVVDKFIGDSIMAFWGAPDENSNQAYGACLSALQIQRFLKIKNSDWINLGLPPFKTRIGIHTDTAIVGNIGAKNRMNYTAIGDSVNLAARLEGLNKVFNTSILISEDTFRKINGDFLTRPLGRVAVKGKDRSIAVYELVAALKHVDINLLISPQAMRDYEKYQVAYDYINDKRFKSALEILQDIMVKDGPVQMLINACEEYIQNPPEDNWGGLIKKMDIK